MTKAIIIGGGIAGCSTAYALAKRGMSVTLLERHHALAQEASGNQTAMLYPKLSIKPTTLSSVTQHGFTFTLALLKQLDAENKIHQTCGQLQLPFNIQEKIRQDILFNQWHQNKQHQHLQFLDTATASSKVGIELKTGGLYLSEAGWVKPLAFCEKLTHSHLITTVTSTKALQLIQTSSDWQVLINGKGDDLQAEIVVICNANDAKMFTPCKNLPITAVRGQVNFFCENTTSQQIKAVICSDHHLGPSVDGAHTIGTSYAPNDLNPNISNVDTYTNLLSLQNISPQLYDSINLSKVTARVAWRSATKDYLPLAGQIIDEKKLLSLKLRHNSKPIDLPWLEGLYINAGHGSKGMITAPICGEFIANLIHHEPLSFNQAIVSKLNASRFALRSLGLKQLANALY